MKKFTIILTVLIAMTINSNAQIPNNGFENWITVGSYMEPQGWATTNPNSAGGFYAVTQSTDHYPVNVGSYSVRIENDTSLLFNGSGMGIIMSGDSICEPQPVFPITGHPNSFCGYYKFIPQNNDTLCIGLQLFLGGQSVSGAALITNVAAPNWTPFNVPFMSYVSADGGHITLSPWNAGPISTPYGNSVLYVDNLSFDSLITSVPEQLVNNILFNLYPNPALDIVTLNIDNTNNEDLALNIYNIMGVLVKSEMLKQSQRQINIRDLSNGIYMITIKSKNLTEKQKLIIQR